ncbi:hypothetical protein ACIBEJ_35300 [Nonomuraea sp. NPDC050790]|uniref:hypothetical protein n=1 Tax=Nonomuraea sp. NPDC050790 TaxID=3364371 RepID=UPI0037A6F940
MKNRFLRWLCDDPAVEPFADRVKFAAQRRAAERLADRNPAARRELIELAERAERTWVHDEQGSARYLAAERDILDRYRR